MRTSFLRAFDEDKQSRLAIRERDAHNLFFRSDYHWIDIGRELFNTLISKHKHNNITVNASTYAVSFYKSMGWKLTERQNHHGLTSIPIKCYFYMMKTIAQFLENLIHS